VVPIELRPGSTVRTLITGSGGDNELLAVMWANMPGNGIAEPKLRSQRTLQPASYHLLNSRILDHAIGFVNEDISALFLEGLSRYRALTQAAQDSRVDPKQDEVLVTLIEPYQITSTHEPYIALVVNGTEIDRIVFEISIVFGMFQTAVAVRRGAIEAVDSEACSLGITLTLQGWPAPLLQRDLPLRVRLPVRPPFPIPLLTQT
jgi:hypothetical protein